MEKTIEQILNESIVGKKILTRKNEIGTILSVRVNCVGGSGLCSLTLDINGKVKKETVRKNWDSLNFIED